MGPRAPHRGRRAARRRHADPPGRQRAPRRAPPHGERGRAHAGRAHRRDGARARGRGDIAWASPAPALGLRAQATRGGRRRRALRARGQAGRRLRATRRGRGRAARPPRWPPQPVGAGLRGRAAARSRRARTARAPARRPGRARHALRRRRRDRRHGEAQGLATRLHAPTDRVLLVARPCSTACTRAVAGSCSPGSRSSSRRCSASPDSPRSCTSSPAATARRSSSPSTSDSGAPCSSRGGSSRSRCTSSPTGSRCRRSADACDRPASRSWASSPTRTSTRRTRGSSPAGGASRSPQPGRSAMRSSPGRRR